MRNGTNYTKPTLALIEALLDDPGLNPVSRERLQAVLAKMTHPDRDWSWDK